MTEKFSLFTSLRYDPALLGVPAGPFKHAGWNAEVASPFYLLDYHRDRMLQAATHWNWTAAADAISGPEGLKRLEKFLLTALEHSQGQLPTVPMRVKVILTQHGELALEKSEVPAVPIANLLPERLPESGREHAGQAGDESGAEGLLLPQREPVYEVIADRSGTHRSEYTHFKTTHRPMYDSARHRAGIGLTDHREVLLINDATGGVMEGSTTTPYFWREGRWITPPVSPRFSAEVGSGGQDGTTRRWALERKMAVEEEIKVESLQDGEECWVSNGVRGFIFGKVRVQTSEDGDVI